jgi:hypothetical protein
MKAMGILNRMFQRRWILEDIAAVVALFGVLISIILDETMYRWQIANPGLKYHDTFMAKILKCILSVDSIVLVVLMGIIADIVVYKKQLRGIYPKNASVWSWPTELRSFLLEALICIIHVPVGVDFYINFGNYSYHVNVFNMFTLSRLYLLLRVMRNHSGFYGQNINFIASMNGVDSMNVGFNFKMLLKNRPGGLLLPMFVINTLATAVALTVFERPDPHANLHSYGDAVYLSLITMSTVGYGDYYPVTTFGQLTVIFGGVVGGTLLATLLITVFVNCSATTHQEDYVINIVLRRKWKKKLREKAASVIQYAFRSRMLEIQQEHGATGVGSEIRNMHRNLFTAIQDMRNLRLLKPDDQTDRQIQDEWAMNIKKVLDTLRGEEGPEFMRSGKAGENIEADLSILELLEELKDRQAALEDLTKELTTAASQLQEKLM